MKPATLARLSASLALALTPVLGTAPASAQTDSVTVTPGARYSAAPLHRLLLGSDYRDLWTTPIRVPILDLEGLRPVERGSGMQTRSLRFRAEDGIEYNFRSVDKDQAGGMHPDFQGTLVSRVAQDQVSSKHPLGALIAAPIMDAVGILHPGPALYVMPDDARLGEYRAEFAGMLGMLEIHPNELGDDLPGFAGALRVAAADRLLEHLEESPEHRADARAYLRARLVDLLIGDWDRHLGQWRWARYDDPAGGYRWVPIPEDRDNAFSSFDGLLPKLLRGAAPQLTPFGPRYPALHGLVNNAQELDRRILAELDREAFRTEAAELRARITDAVLRGAVDAVPPPYRELRSESLLDDLRARRDALPQVAMDYYALLAREVDVRATDEDDLATAHHREDGSLEVVLRPRGGDDRPYFHRIFHRGETREVRIYLHGGSDRAVARGSGPGGIAVRFIGGGGDDTLVDSTAARGVRAAFYDDRGDNRFVRARRTVVDTRTFVAPQRDGGGFNDNAPAFRDWGREMSWFAPYLSWRYNAGPVIGGGPTLTRYGFRRVPHARRVALRGLYAPLHSRFGVELEAESRLTNSPGRLQLTALASQLEVTRFHGFGNESQGGGPSDRYKVWETEYAASLAYHHSYAPGAEVFLGPTLRYTRLELPADGPATTLRPAGSEPHGTVGLRLGGSLDRRNSTAYPTRGGMVRVEAAAHPDWWSAPGEFGRVEGMGAAYLPLPLAATLAVRAGGSAAFGDYPFQEAAFLGGSRTLRGTPRQRFAGGAALYAGGELRGFLTRFNFVSRGDLGFIALADAGRVFVDGEDSDRIHTGVGGGLWVGILDRSRTASLVFASGTEEALYLSFGMPF